MNKKQIVSSFIVFFSGIFISSFIAAAFSKSENFSSVDFFTGVFSSVYYTGSVLNTAFLLIVSGLGAAAAIINGELNLGGEGQIYAGGFAAAFAAFVLKNVPPLFSVPAAFIFSCAVSALISLISAVLKYYKNADIILTSFLISCAVIPVINSLIAISFRDSGSLLATPFISQNMCLPKILLPSPLNAGIFSVPFFCTAAWYFIYKTPTGRQVIINGKAKEFAKCCGYNQKKMMFYSIGISGAFHGAAGFFAVFGTYGTCHSGFYSGLGWNGLTTALAAFSNPLMLVPCAFVLSWIFTSAGRAALLGNFGFNFTSLVQGIMLFCVAITAKEYNLDVFSKMNKFFQKKILFLSAIISKKKDI